jgi:mutual gliding-motility protein MglA
VVVVSYSGKEINAKLVYYGAGLSGKTTNLEAIYEAVPETSRGKMVSMKTQSDRTLFFDLLPLDLGEIMGFKTRFLLYTVPGQVFYNATRKLVLKGADAVVFVADSGIGKMEENKESLANLRANLSEYGLKLEEIPFVVQYNKRDLPNVYSVEELNAELNPDGAWQTFEAVATQGAGVFETFRGVSHLLMQKVTRELRRSPHSSRGAKAEPEPSHQAPIPGGSLPEDGAGLRAAPSVLRPKAAQREQQAEPRDFDYGRELKFGDAPAASPPARTQSASEMGDEIRFDDDAGPPRKRRTLGAQQQTPAPDAPAAKAFVERTLELGTRGAAPSAGGSSEVVVPIRVPARGTREIVLRIVIQTDSDAEAA